MKPNQMAILVLRLMGIYCLIQVIPTLSVVATAVSFSQASPVDGKAHTLSSIAIIAAALLPFAFRLIVGILLLVYSVTWGERLIPHEVAQENIAAISFAQVQALAFAVAGVLIFADALPQLFNSISHLISWVTAGRNDWQNQGAYRAYTFREATTAIGTVLKAILGLMLFFRAKGFVNFWRSLRTFATPKPPQAAP